MKNLTQEDRGLMVLDLVAAYNKDPNCRPEMWIVGEDVTPEEKREFLTICLTKIWQQAYTISLPTKREKVSRLRELLTWDKPRNGNEIEHTAKVTALQNLIKEN